MKRPLVVTDAGRGEGRPRAARLRRCSKAASIAYARLRRGGAEPDREGRLRRARGVPQAQGCDGIIAVGGGSPLDAAKLSSCSPRTSRRCRATTTPRAATSTCSDNMPPLDRHPDHRGHGLGGQPLGRGHARGHRAQDGHLQPLPAAQGGHLRPRAHPRAAARAHRGHGHGRLHPLPRGLPVQRLPPARGRGGHRRHRPRGALAAHGRARTARTCTRAPT